MVIHKDSPMRIKQFVFLLILSAFSIKSYSTHIVGGEIFYDFLGNDNYKITLKVYRDCYNGQAPYDDPATIFVFNSSGILIDSVGIPFPGSAVLPATINNPCYSAPTNVCVEEAVYETTLALPPLSGGYNIVYQRCCRNNSIMNLVMPGDVGATYMAHIPTPAQATGNSSPRYNHFPPIFLCVGVPLIFDHSATDPNGDSLYYDLCDPYVGLDPGCPIAGAAAVAQGCPAIIQPPAYAFVPWLAPYNVTYPMSVGPAISIDHHTGLLTGTPNMIGQWVMAVCVSEYRNGVLLDVNKRDFQFNVTNCPVVVASTIPSQTVFCFGNTVNFFNTSVNAFSYHWDFGDPTTTSDTSNISAPTYTYADSGVYVVTLTINPNTPCSDTGQTTFYIYPNLAPSFIPPPGQCVYDNHYNFTLGGDYLGNGTFSWNFGPHGTPSSSTLENPINIHFDTIGAIPVTVTVSENGCTADYTANVMVYPKPDADFDLLTTVACMLSPVYFADSSHGESPFTYNWNFGNGTSSNSQFPNTTYQSTGNYNVTLIITSQHGCKDTVTMPNLVQVYPLPQAGFVVTPTDTSIFYPNVHMTDHSVSAVSCEVFWGDGSHGTNCNAPHTYAQPGIYNIVQVVTNVYGCTDTAFSTVIIRPEFRFWVPNAFTPGGDDLNEVFKPVLIGVHDYTFYIFDRWGEKLFETNDTKVGWDGTYKNNPAASNVFVYKISFRDDVEDKFHQYIGSATLVR